MRILNFGSLNIDRVYSVSHFVTSGETIKADNLDFFCGGKGLNQSIAVARAGSEIYHAGAVGQDGEELCALLKNDGVNTDFLQHLQEPSGHAVIQVTPKGQNCIIVFAGSNASVTPEYIDSVLKHFSPGDILLLQNEISNVEYVFERASRLKMRIFLNPSPITESLLSCRLDLVDCFILNETEGAALTGTGESDYEKILQKLAERFPAADIVLTIGKRGVLFAGASGKRARHGIYDVPIVDTTAAGDTFCGYYISSVSKGESVETALEKASVASSLAVSRKGASPSIPTIGEVESFRRSLQNGQNEGNGASSL